MPQCSEWSLLADDPMGWWHGGRLTPSAAKFDALHDTALLLKRRRSCLVARTVDGESNS